MKQGSNQPDKEESATSVGEAVTAKLKAYYETIVNQDVPDRFIDLLAKLDSASAGAAPADAKRAKVAGKGK